MTPAFVIAGQPNEGKTTVAATLTEDERARIGPDGGTTRELKEYKVVVDGELKLLFYDTPGFENPGELFEWFRENAKHHDNPAAAFLSIPEHRRDYPFDCEILKPIAEGAAVIHVINPARKPAAADKFEAEIFYSCRNQRVGLLNRRSDEPGMHPDWEILLSLYMNTWREFNACEAVFADRVELLKALTIAVPRWNRQMENVIDSLTEQWNTRLSETASAIVQTLRDAVKIQIFELYHGKDDEEAAKSKAEKEVRTRLTELEKDCRRKAREIFCHIDDHWTLEESLELGLFDKKVWQVFGFSKNSLRVAWAVAGASVGTWIDIATGGGTVGIGALLGAAVGVVIGNLSADEFVKISLPGLHLGPLKIPGRKIGGVSLKAGIERLKGPSVLLDRITCYAVAAARWSHGRRIEVASNRQTDDTCRISRMLENTQDLQQDGTKNDPKGNSAIARFQILIELWHLSCDKTLSTKQERIVHETEAWLKKRLVEHLYRATCEKTENTNNHLKPQID